MIVRKAEKLETEKLKEGNIPHSGNHRSYFSFSAFSFLAFTLNRKRFVAPSTLDY